MGEFTFVIRRRKKKRSTAAPIQTPSPADTTLKPETDLNDGTIENRGREAQIQTTTFRPNSTAELKKVTRLSSLNARNTLFPSSKCNRIQQLSNA